MVEALEIKKKSESKLFDIPGVVGVGLINPAQKITIYVEKLTSEIIKKIPTEINGVPVVIIETGEFTAFQRTGRMRPALGGISIGHYAITAGTLGTRTIDNVSGKRVILSNNHVLANADSIQNSRASKGDAIYQPGRIDGGSSADTLANLERWVKIDEVGTNKVDCAIATPINDADLSDEILDIGIVNEMVNVTEGMSIQKSGRTTGLTTGTVMDINLSLKVNYGPFVANFTDCIFTTEGFGGPGDSGSAVCTGNKIVGLLFAGNSAGNIIACKIGNVVDSLNISFVPTPTPILPLLGGVALMASPTIIPKEMIKPSTRKLLMFGGLAVAGYGLYSYLKKKKEEPIPPPPPPPGTYINVNSTPSGASVLLSGVNIGNTPITNYKIEPGTYTLILVLIGYELYEEPFTISKGETKTFNITLVPIAPEVSATINEFTITT